MATDPDVAGGFEDPDGTTNCIGELEHHIHKVFSGMRIPGEDFVYHPIPELFTNLENYCNDVNSDSTRAPLLVVGESGLGKSALLSNWLDRRFRNGQRMRTAEFVFWHAVGCSRQSTNVNNLIRRLIVDLKQRFEIPRDVPVRQERLSWELPRFLDLASRKGKIIIVIDGVHRLMSDDNTEASLAWLPLELPQNVKFVMSATIPKNVPMFEENASSNSNSMSSVKGLNISSQNDSNNGGNGKSNVEKHVEGFYSRSPSPGAVGGVVGTARNSSPLLSSRNAHHNHPANDSSANSPSHGGAQSTTTGSKKGNGKGRILSEIERRPWTLLRIKPLDPHQCRALIMSYIQKTVQSEASASTANSSSFFLTSGPLSAPSGDQISKAIASEQLSGFLLFECHIRSLQQHPCGGLPLFIRLFLRCAHLCCCRGFSLWHLWDDWLKAEHVTALLERIMETIEVGHTKTEAETQQAVEKFFLEGGVPALSKLYPWHPALAPRIDEDAFAAIDFAVMAANERPNAHAAAMASGHGNSSAPTGSKDPAASVNSASSHNGSILVSLADQQWLSAADAADIKFEAAKIKTDRMVNDVVNTTKRHVQLINSKQGDRKTVTLMDAVEESVTRVECDQEDGNGSNRSQVDLLDAIKDASINTIGGDIDDIIAEEEYEDDSSDDEVIGTDTEKGEEELSERTPNSNSARDKQLEDAEQGDSYETDGGALSSKLAPPKIGRTTMSFHTSSFLTERVLQSEASASDMGKSLVSADKDGNSASKAAPVPPLVKINDRSDNIKKVPSAEVTSDKSLPMLPFPRPEAPAGAGAGANSSASSETVRSIDLASSSRSDGAIPAPPVGMMRGNSLAVLLQRGASIRSNSRRVLDTYANSSNASKHAHMDELAADINLQPAYFRGGANVKGLDSLLGNALSLLFVSRHGLKEEEMWALLASLSEEHYRMFDTSSGDKSGGTKTAQQVREQERKRTEDAWRNRDLVLVLFAERGGLEDVWATYDPLKTSLVPYQSLLSGLRKVREDMGQAELNTLLELLNLNGLLTNGSRLFPDSSTEFVQRINGTAPIPIRSSNALEEYERNYQPYLHDLKINYLELLRRLVSAASAAKRSEIKTKLTPKIFQDPDGLDNLEKFLIGSEADDRIKAHDEGGAHEDMDSWDNFSVGSTASKALSTTSTIIHPHTNANKLKKNNKEAHLSLGPIVEESLLGVLCALGILHSPEHQVMLLPIESKACRMLVRRRYVMNRGGDNVWHDHLIRHFQREATCMRRCEELPWHLQLCRKWYTLKDTLTDLKTFELMFTSDLKHELMDYWIVLTEGPLFLTSEAAKAAQAMVSKLAMNERGSSQTSLLKGDRIERQQILNELDSALALGLSDKEAKLHLMKDKIAPFDVVEEYNRSIENWIFRVHPTIQSIQQSVSLISGFMAQFSSLITDSPEFLRLGIELKSLSLFGINFEELNVLETPLLPSANKIASADDAPGENRDRDSLSGTAVEDAKKFPTPQQLAGNHYAYIRWIWVQFPWLAMKNAVIIGRKLIRDKELKHAANSRAHLGVSTAASATTTSLPSANSTALLGSASTSKINQQSGAHANWKDDDSYLNSPANRSAASSATGGGGGGMFSPFKAPTATYWKAMKRDPTLPIIAQSPYKRQSAINATLKDTTSSLKILQHTAHGVHTEDCRLFGGKAGHPSHIKLNSSKYRRSLEEENEALKGIPFSEHSVRAQKQNTLFPTVETMTKERNAQVEENDMKIFEKAMEVERRGGVIDIFEMSLADELKMIMDEERLSAINKLQGNVFPLSDVEAEFNNEVNRLAKMRALFDRSVLMRRQRKKLLHSLQRQVSTHDQEDVLAISQINSGEAAIEVANNRLAVLNEALEEATELTMGYQKILEVVAATPPYLDHHLAEIESNLTLARQQLQDMIMYRKNMYIHAERMNSIKTQQLNQKLEYYSLARKKIARKRKDFLEKHGIVEDPKETADAADANDDSSVGSYASGRYGLGSPGKKGPKSSRIHARDRAAARARSRKQVSLESGTISSNGFRAASPDTDKDKGTSKSKLVRRKTEMGMDKGSSVSDLTNKKVREGSASREKGRDKADKSDSDASLTKSNSNGTKDALPAIMHSLVDAFKKASNEVYLSSVDRPNSSELSATENEDTEDNETEDDAEEASTGNSSKFVGKFELARSSSNVVGVKGRSRLLAAMAAVDADSREKKHQQRKKKRKTGILHDKDQLLGSAIEAFNRKAVASHTMNNAKEMSCRLQLDFLIEKTGSVNENEFLERFFAGQKTKDSLKAMQNLADSKLSQLRAEHAELIGSLGKTRFQVQEEGVNKTELFIAAGGAVAGDRRRESINAAGGLLSPSMNSSTKGGGGSGALGSSGAGNDKASGAADSDMDVPNNDEKKLIKMEMVVASKLRLIEKLNTLINEVKSGTGHLVKLITINSRLLQNLQRSTPPPMIDNDDICKCLLWVEERLTNINEAMMLDSSKPGMEQDINYKSLFERQIDLAANVQKLTAIGKDKPNGKKRRQGKNAGDMSRVVIDSQDTNNFTSDPRTIVVQATNEIDKKYEREMKDLIARRDYNEDIQEKNKGLRGKGTTQGLSVFLSEALATPDSLEALRRSNALTNSVQGERSGLGFALEGMLSSELPTDVQPPRINHRHKPSEGSSKPDKAWQYWEGTVKVLNQEKASAKHGDSPKKKATQSPQHTVGSEAVAGDGIHVDTARNFGHDQQHHQQSHSTVAANQSPTGGKSAVKHAGSDAMSPIMPNSISTDKGED